MSERRDGPLCADCDQHDEEPQAPAPAVVAVPDEKPVGPVPDEQPSGLGPGRVGCRTELRGWAGAHLHGAVRPRRRSTGHGRPPGRWC